jgi:hypothetical protein
VENKIILEVVMPLVILGLFVIIGIVIYALVKYGNSDDEDSRSVRERYPHAFPQKKDVRDIFESFTHIDEEESISDPDDDSDGNTIKFPDNAELEKRKRNIH